MSQTLNQNFKNQSHSDEMNEVITHKKPAITTDDWSHTTKDLLDSLPQVWTRGLLYFLIVFVSIILPWAMLSRVDETGEARGRLEPQGKTVRLDAPVTGTIAQIQVKEGDIVKAGQTLLVLESELVKTELQQVKNRLEGQLNKLAQSKLLKNQLLLALATQRQQNQSQELEKLSQINQAKVNLNAIKSASNLQTEEKLSQVNQAKQSVEYSKTAYTLIASRLASSQREVNRYRQLWKKLGLHTL
ncbi:biotin/lipoyl-binding protein [Anabaena aphanizomenioides LEGE 00250]|uniref:Biotin/lipoyl-binding protein n=1 Tax=Sphaerospermopsis aphanizomenoides LEGE 00250 TaxID=2777972 RepID=A0ABR9VK07_9CYAN|nr:biotin/lipoyl-binding protein [Sphaerospermopsis aphanizomenoides]MBE9238829.1 biotin/lipoyl-binding protein [Sphaerospermopsis aphanizomenoides LEGE 00250]